MARLMKIARRGFLFGSVALAGGVAFGWWRYATPYPNPLVGTLPDGDVTLNPWVIINTDGVTVVAPRAEMGQGIQSTLAALVAEEMDLAWADVRVMHGPPALAYYNSALLQEGAPFAPTDRGWLAETVRGAMDIPAKFLAIQATGGSSATPDAYEKMRLAGAAARMALVQAAANRLGVDAATLRTENGAVIGPDGAIPYPDLAADAAGIDVGEPTLRPRSDWKLLGRDLPRIGMAEKVTGTATFAVDVRLPGMLFATVKTNPHLEAPMVSYDASAAEGMPGVERIVPVDNGVAVVATTTWHARQAMEAVTFDWAPAAYPASSAEMLDTVRASFTPDLVEQVGRDEGTIPAALAGDQTLSAEYTVPFLAHATMEPMSAAAHLVDGRLTIWIGTQGPRDVQQVAAAAAGLEPEAVTVHTTYLGGGFGRRGEVDFAKQAAQIAVAMAGTPILLTWTREEDMTHDMYRPQAVGRVAASVTGGRVDTFDFGTACASVFASSGKRRGRSFPGPDVTILQGSWEQPYDFANFRVTGYRVPEMVPVGAWRSVGASQNAFFLETAIDELAHLAGADPLEFRLSQMAHDPSRKVLEAVAAMSGWGNVPPGRARGVAYCLSFGAPTAQVIEVADDGGRIRLTGAWAAIDVGVALDPRNVQAQVSGAMVYGLSAAIRGEITFADGMVEQQNFWDYEPLRMLECPPIMVQVLEHQGHITGVGEPGTPPAAPALGNAIFALTGQRLRDLPFNRAVDFA